MYEYPDGKTGAEMDPQEEKIREGIRREKCQGRNSRKNR